MINCLRMLFPKLSDEEKQILLIEIESEVYRRSFYEFFVAATKVLYPQIEWSYNWHFKYIADLLEAEVRRIIKKKEKTKDLIINLPFRSGKSILLSQIFPVWCWIIDPTLGIMQVSHNESLAVKHSHASKMLIESEWFKLRFKDLTLRMDTHAKSNYMTNYGGKRISFGVQSGIIGEGCNIMIVDDINNPSDSQAVMKTINETYTDTLYSRLNNPSIDLRIILQQRVNENDICGYLLNKNPDKYHHICLPAQADNNINPPELIKYYKRSLFWYTRFTHKVLLDFKSTLGSKAYAGQLMQKPYAEEGSIIKRKWFKIISYDELSKLLLQVKPEWNLWIDTAYTSKSINDATAIILVAKIHNSIYIKKAWKVWQEFPELINTIKTLQKTYDTRLIYIESKASGLSIKQQLQRDGFNCVELNPKDKDKISRANAVTPIMEGGRVILIDDSSNEMLLQELAGFPFGADDLVDVVVYAVDTLLNKNNFNFQMT